MRLFVIYLIGLCFGIGIAVSGMANPAKVLNFFDVAGTWDPSLGFVMFAALATAALGYKLTFRAPKPVFAQRFNVPTSRTIDARLVAGSAVFGVGWGISGFCPGASVPSLGTGAPAAILFFAAMVIGILLAKWGLQLTARLNPRNV